MTRADRNRVIGRIADHLVTQPGLRPWRVAVDGITGAGKTTVAGEVAAAVRARGRSAVQVSMDGFHHPRERRHRQGRQSATGYYTDAYDLGATVRYLLAPLGPEGDRYYRTAVLDLASDTTIDASDVQAPADLVLVVDGTFLQRPELDLHFDEVIYVDTAFELACDRAVERDAAAFGGRDEAREAVTNRYHAACRQYLHEVPARERAGILLGNDDLAAPELLRIGGAAGSTVSLFSYGTLQQPDVQQSSFHRLLEGHPDVLPGYRTDWVEITDPDVIAASGSNRHPTVRPGDDQADAMPGTVFTIGTDELAAADLYEVDDYRRQLVRLGSGQSAWVYLAAG